MATRPCLPRATVVGLSGKQTALLRRHVSDVAQLRILTPDRALKFRGDDSDVVIITRFVGHKHEHHLRRVATCPVVFLRAGAVDAVLRTLRSVRNVDVIAA